MLSTIVAVLSLSVMLLVVASLVISALFERRRQSRAVAEQRYTPSCSLQSHALFAPYIQNGAAVGADKLEHQQTTSLPPSWYTRSRTFISLGLLLMVLLTLFVQSGLVDGALKNLGQSLSFLSASHSSAVELQTAPHLTQVNASQELVRISQLDPNQYSSPAEYNTWAYSACSAAAMTEIFNAYGHHYRITDVLQVEARIGEISPALGLLRPGGIEHTAAQFGFKTTWGNSWTIDQVINTANQGKPVIVSFPPDRYAGGHILVVTGGNSTTVSLADTSYWNRHSLTRAQFLQWWEGFAAVVIPR